MSVNNLKKLIYLIISKLHILAYDKLNEKKNLKTQINSQTINQIAHYIVIFI